MNIAALRNARLLVCSYCCTSHYKTADGPPPHSDECKAIQEAIEQAEIDAGWRSGIEAIAGEIGVTPADVEAVNDFCERESMRAVCDATGVQFAVEINKERLAQCFAKHRLHRG